MKNLLAAVAAGSLLVGSTVAVAETRPEVTRFSQPVAVADANQDWDDKGPLFWFFGALLTAAVIWAIIELLKSNSPNRR